MKKKKIIQKNQWQRKNYCWSRNKGLNKSWLNQFALLMWNSIVMVVFTWAHDNRTIPYRLNPFKSEFFYKHIIKKIQSSKMKGAHTDNIRAEKQAKKKRTMNGYGKRISRSSLKEMWSQSKLKLLHIHLKKCVHHLS